jgi:hypothetical protein
MESPGLPETVSDFGSRLGECDARKHSEPSASTEQRRESERSDEHPLQAFPPIDDSLESRGKLTATRDSQSKTHSAPCRSTEEGMQMEERDEQPRNARSPILKKARTGVEDHSRECLILGETVSIEWFDARRN